MINLYNNYQESIIAIQKVPMDQTYQYGIVEGEKVEDRVVRVERMFEKPKPGTTDSNLAIIGRYILQPEIFAILEGTEPGHGGEIQLTDALLALSRLRPMFAYEFQGTRFDAGDKLGYLKAIIAFALRHPTVGKEFRKHIKEVCVDL
jgi:UTP--glucose-1-phosphate uridylyltransferase